MFQNRYFGPSRDDVILDEPEILSNLRDVGLQLSAGAANTMGSLYFLLDPPPSLGLSSHRTARQCGGKGPRRRH